LLVRIWSSWWSILLLSRMTRSSSSHCIAILSSQGVLRMIQWIFHMLSLPIAEDKDQDEEK
jgi:hypothetical protein